MKKITPFLLCMLCFIVTGFSQTEGDDITMRNTLQDPGADEVTYPSLFMQADDAFDEFATLSNTEIEFDNALGQPSTATGLPFDLSGLYEIDLTETSIEFKVLPDTDHPFWSGVFGIFPEGKVDRYYFTFSDPHNITSAATNHASVNLRIDSETTVVVEISEGYDLKPGQSFFISLNGAEALTNEEKARGFNMGLESGDPAALKWMHNDYIQHNVTVPTGKEGIAFFYTGMPIGLDVNITRSFEAGDYVFAQTTFGGSWGNISGSGTDQIIYDVWRFEDGFAIEHWDNIGDVIDDMDGTTQSDGVVTPVTDLASTDANKALLEEMAQTLFVEGDWTNVSTYFDLDNYVQHSVGAGPDGAFLASLEGQTGVSFYDDVKFIHVSGNFGLVMSQGPDITGQDPDGDYAYYDLFRMENGKIVEHWDIIEHILPSDQWVNNNGKWGDDAITGIDVTMRNTLQDPGQPEVTYPSLFMQPDDAFDEFAPLSYNAIEFESALAQPSTATGLPFDLSGLYEIDITETSIDFSVLPDETHPFWSGVFGVFPAGKFDRYYFTFSEPHNITSAISSNPSINLRIDSETVVVVEISEGFDLTPGASFSIQLNADLIMRNTLQDPGQPEVTYPSLFMQPDDAFDEFAALSNTAIEFENALGQPSTATGLPFDLSGLYEIDLTETSIEFKVLPDETHPFWSGVFGEFPAGKVDRYYFTYSEPHNITSASSNHTSVNLIILSETEIVVEISEGYDLKPGQNFFISLNGEDGLTNEEKAKAFNTGLINGDASVIKWIRNDYIQHNLGVPDGKEPIAGFYGGQPTGITVNIHRSFEVGDYVFAQTTLGGTWGDFFGSGGDNILYEVWRFEDGMAVEHWDNIVDVVDDMDGTTQTDGVVTPATDLGSTDANRALLEEMSQTLFVDGDWTNVSDYFDLDAYVQHSVGAGPDGAFLASLEGQTGFSFYDDVKFIHVLGNFGLVMSQGPDITGQDLENPYAYYDLFRMENGKIVEHWDAIQMIPPQEEWAHDNGKWGDDAISNSGVDLNLNLTATNQLYEQYGAVNYVFTLTNEGDETATNNVVELSFPSGLVYTSHNATIGDFELFTNDWTIPSLAPGETAMLHLILFSLVDDQELTFFTQVVASDQADIDSTPNNSSGEVQEDDESSVTVSPQSGGGFGTNNGNNDLELSITTTANSYGIYEVVPYTISLTNNGEVPATGIIVHAGLPEGMAFTNASTGDGNYNLYFQEWTIAELGAGQTAVLEMDLFTLVADQSITNFVQIFVANEQDPDSTPGNNTTEIPTEDDEAAVTIQINALNNGALPQMELVRDLNLTDASGKPIILPLDAYTNNLVTDNLLAATSRISLAPNPFNDITYIEIELLKGGAYEFEVSDMVTGKVVTQKTIELQEGINKFKYDGGHLQNGCYNYRLSSKDGSVHGKMIVVER